MELATSANIGTESFRSAPGATVSFEEGAVVATGNEAQRTAVAFSPTPDVCWLPSGIAQRCFPVERQQAGRRDAVSATRTGAISQRLTSATRNVAKSRRMSFILLCFSAVVFKFRPRLLDRSQNFYIFSY
jgi:hypothetical protein